MESYDYILAGAGCAGLSLVYYLLESDLKDSKILLIDPAGQEVPDKTWCYWAEKPLAIHPKDSIHYWNDLSFTTGNIRINKNLGSLNYYHLNSHDFYKSLFKKLTNHPNVVFLQDEVQDIIEGPENIQVNTKISGSFLANYAFDSRLKQENFKDDSILKQVFLGWKVKTEKAVFEPKHITLMEFSKEKSDQFEFFYILPFSKTEALVEYTCYSQKNISEKILKDKLEAYLTDLTNGDPYQVSFNESGIIPMSTKQSPKFKSKRIVKIGTAAGWTKASTGYTFHSIQKNCQEIIRNLETGKLELLQLNRASRFSFYDNILLNIAHKWPNRLQSLFLNLFDTSSADVVLRFLSEETRFVEEIRLLGKLRFPIFIKSLLKYATH
ncbi:lycopene cyclase family protein [Algoriphagus sp.]|uniref:lycopene cyclase family protein n=1 Tax=Algoriphagus sp. TaxID=1872435 RepID=UPI00271E72B6|nr:lycopene cyclase family protein [Algoriphagus sp.]MDO8968094.1 lycopene cyclase family protein [Algoriphagus sp.]MDP3202195.1 lycopene cyclase family protein [Algoriphagus sp.]